MRITCSLWVRTLVSLLLITSFPLDRNNRQRRARQCLSRSWFEKYVLDGVEFNRGVAPSGGTPHCMQGAWWGRTVSTGGLLHSTCQGTTRAINTGYCKAHGGNRRCQELGCTKEARGTTGYCKAHGGGRRCQEVGCTTAAVTGGTQHCQAHGGGRRCRQAGMYQPRCCTQRELQALCKGCTGDITAREAHCCTGNPDQSGHGPSCARVPGGSAVCGRGPECGAASKLGKVVHRSNIPSIYTGVELRSLRLRHTKTGVWLRQTTGYFHC